MKWWQYHCAELSRKAKAYWHPKADKSALGKFRPEISIYETISVINY